MCRILSTICSKLHISVLLLAQCSKHSYRDLVWPVFDDPPARLFDTFWQKVQAAAENHHPGPKTHQLVADALAGLTVRPAFRALDADGLDACCLDDTTFVKAYAGFQLVRNSDAQTVPKRSAGENVSPNASRVAKKAREA